VTRPFSVAGDERAIEFLFGDDVGVRVARDGSRVVRTRGPVRSALVAEAIWGAGLVLALALRVPARVGVTRLDGVGQREHGGLVRAAQLLGAGALLLEDLSQVGGVTLQLSLSRVGLALSLLQAGPEAGDGVLSSDGAHGTVSVQGMGKRTAPQNGAAGRSLR